MHKQNLNINICIQTLEISLKKELADIEAAGLYKKERVITTPQRADIKVNAGEEVLNFCANNYLACRTTHA